MNCERPESHCAAIRRFTSHDLHKHFGNRNFRNYKTFEQVAEGILLSERAEAPLSIGDFLNINVVPPVIPFPVLPIFFIRLVLILAMVMVSALVATAIV
jgi:hypothetical protein